MYSRLIHYCLLIATFGSFELADAFAQQPNIVHIFADDLGYGSVGFNGQTQIQTPSLDALAAGGLVFDNAYAATVCGPSRAMLLSGFHNGHTRVDRNSNLGNSAGNGFAADEVMTGQVLRDAGYATAAMGKWGFGGSNGRNIGSGTPDPIPTVADSASLPTNHGFDEFFGYLNHNRAHDYLIDHLWQDDAGEPSGVGLYDNRVGGVAVYSPDPIHQRAGQFIQDKAGGSQPFYMQMNYTIPHWDIDAVDAAPAVLGNDGQPITNTAGRGIYTGSPTMGDNEEQYAAMITRMDTYIGLLVERLDDPNADGDNSDSVLDNTLIMFSSDNGATTEDGSPVASLGANDPFRGGKRDLYEGGVRVPTLAYWPDKIGNDPGQVTPGVNTRRIDLADFLPTAAELAGTYGPVGMDGVSIASLLTGDSDRVQRNRESLLFEHFEGGGLDPDGRSPRWAIVKDDKKLIRYSNGTSDLFDLAIDPTEQNNIAGTQVALVTELEALAVAEGAGQANSYAVAYRTWTGGNGDDVGDDANWSGTGSPAENWSAVLANTAAGDQTAQVTTDVTTLGFEVRGNGATARQTVVVNDTQTLIGRNEVRISPYGAIELEGGTVEANRWVDVLVDGELRGFGLVDAEVYNLGQVSINGADSATGVLEVESDYFQLVGGELQMEVGGTTGGDQFDQLAIGQTANLGGTLSVAFIDGFEPADGEFFPLVNADALVGQFDQEVLPAPSPGVSLSIQYLSNLVVLVAGDFQLKDGDVNLDGELDQLDVNDFVTGWLHEQPVPDMHSYT
ncbi:MAG: sulfatase-like hydrolase/transferase, partial [Aeoliella sp.]